MVKYWPEIGKCGYLVWRYLLRRDDMEPAPWTPEGMERIKKLGLAVQVRLQMYLHACLPFSKLAAHLVLMPLPRASAVPAGLLVGHG